MMRCCQTENKKKLPYKNNGIKIKISICTKFEWLWKILITKPGSKKPYIVRWWTWLRSWSVQSKSKYKHCEEIISKLLNLWHDVISNIMSKNQKIIIVTHTNPLAQLNTLRVAQLFKLLPPSFYQRHYDHDLSSDLPKKSQNSSDK